MPSLKCLLYNTKINLAYLYFSHTNLLLFSFDKLTAHRQLKPKRQLNFSLNFPVLRYVDFNVPYIFRVTIAPGNEIRWSLTIWIMLYWFFACISMQKIFYLLSFWLKRLAFITADGLCSKQVVQVQFPWKGNTLFVGKFGIDFCVTMVFTGCKSHLIYIRTRIVKQMAPP